MAVQACRKAGHNAKSPVLLARYTSKTRRFAQENYGATESTVKLGVIFPIPRTESSIRERHTRARTCSLWSSAAALFKLVDADSDYRALAGAIALA